MGKSHLEKPSGGGLELDKIELPGRPLRDTVRKSAAAPEQKSAPSVEAGPSRKKHLRIAVTAVLTTLALLVALAVYLKKQDLQVSFQAITNYATSDSYLRVGPITTTIEDNEIIRLSLDIACKNDNAKEKLSGKDSRIRDKIVSVISAPDTKTLLKNHQYDEVRDKIRKALEKIYGESIEEIYFAELLTY